MNEDTWPLFPLKDLSSRIGDGIHGTPEYVEFSEFPFVNGNNLKNGSIVITNETRMVSEKEYNKYLIEFDQNTLFMSINGTLGNLAKYNDETITLGKSAAYIKCKDIDIDFLYYYLQLQEVQKHMWNTATGSTIKNLSLDSIRNLHIPKPHEQDQKDIAAVLSTLDAKIDINNRINAELEAMAKTLYDYWFVQFDFPDENGQPYKSSGGMMVYNETLKREIPISWEISDLEQLVAVVKGNVAPEELAGSTPYIGLEHIPRKTIVLSEWETAEKVNSDKCVFKKHDILFGKIRPYFHKVGISFIDGITSTDTIVLRPCKNEYFGLALETIFTDRFIETATQSSTGTKMPRANWEALRQYKVPTPSPKLLDKYQIIFDGIVAKMESSVHQNQKLTQLRDWLLPMLMNGQVTVRDQAAQAQ